MSIAFTTSTTSDSITSSKAVAAQSSKVHGLSLTAGSAAATLTLYDNASAASGVVLDTLTLPANTYWRVDYSFGVQANKGIYAAISGSGATAIVHYELSA